MSLVNKAKHLKEDEQPPYRESKLTQILKPYLQNKCNLLVIVNIQQERESRSQTKESLNFGKSASLSY